MDVLPLPPNKTGRAARRSRESAGKLLVLRRDRWGPLKAFAERITRLVAGRCQIEPMTTRITYWKDVDGRYLGYLNDYPDHRTQGDTLSALKDHLRDLFQTFSKEEIAGIRKEEELEIA
jgi:predicted RNase H-like HicB family nuclease